MADRTCCSLQMHGIVHRDHLDALALAIFHMRPYNMDGSLTADEIRGKIEDGQNEFEFEDVNYAEMSAILMQTLKTLRISHSWRWAEGDSYGAGVYFVNEMKDDCAEFPLAGNQICLTAPDLKKSDRIAKAIEYDNFETGMHLVVYDSNHDLLALHEAGDLPEGCMDLLPKIDLSALPEH